MDDWENALRQWVVDSEEAIVRVQKALFQLGESIEIKKKKLKDMETIRPARVEYQHRKGWALSPQHSGHIPLDAKVVAGIEAAMDELGEIEEHGAITLIR